MTGIVLMQKGGTMTREEAIEMIRDDIKKHHDYISGQYRKALNMAIKALEQEPCEDSVSRQAVTDAMMKQFVEWLLDEIWDEEMWELNYQAFPEVLCRKLVKMGYLKEKDGEYERSN